MALVKWDPFKEMSNLQSSINRLFDENFRFLRTPEQAGFIQGWSFPVDIRETPDNLVVSAEVPGLNREDLKISFADNQLTIRGERRKEIKEERDRYLRVERSYGTFSRTFTVDVPVKTEAIKAKYQDGVLEITLPKKDDIKPRDIEITVD